ncbi:uncharacterized protein PHACADRAFT_214861 [Phanerochaete carnosa HHB-10118-sp]|uniref:Uncharacterized protein n=1 Tax=Phanerochaete carnosa (strain HHB-10118-sp) TaxID=650164 RepID=K5WDU4_PHACS|nr:uncharacterized protein PHACADRAFT_214596 [Phanerochaete carnosa HHB-10118-sp]XP_007403141.1 uncharacterized protein PHACADRAFT_214861 [Phanerochaete carnosa HHB-10118-sp]EKM48307.1 hypothetical protein PHACADRAFT_214861 [Phanerochaete carnosa HHB-10118-sp]EKM48922.1 hypothetical protein PHACADRAFT_214596 [Phanerochaete carnosa HHB-10118-sp]
MYAFAKLLSALSLLAVAHFAPEATAQSPPANRPTGGSICSTTPFLVESVIPANINDNGGELFPPQPLTTYPTYTALSVGTQNYTCGDDGTWAGSGAITYLYDISCLPLDHHQPFTSFIAALWDAAPPTVTAADIVALTEKVNPGVGYGIHYWISDPVNATSGNIYAKWDFSQSERMENDTNKANAYLVAGESANVPAPNDPSVNSNWLVEPVLVINGTKVGQLADEVWRINSNGGQAPNTTCTPGTDLQVKSTLDFLFYGGAWADTIF